MLGLPFCNVLLELDWQFGIHPAIVSVRNLQHIQPPAAISDSQSAKAAPPKKLDGEIPKEKPKEDSH
ncbi:hypothetical protein ABZP36_019287 [Zizania latifolia]